MIQAIYFISLRSQCRRHVVLYIHFMSCPSLLLHSSSEHVKLVVLFWQTTLASKLAIWSAFYLVVIDSINWRPWMVPPETRVIDCDWAKPAHLYWIDLWQNTPEVTKVKMIHGRVVLSHYQQSMTPPHPSPARIAELSSAARSAILNTWKG